MKRFLVLILAATVSTGLLVAATWGTGEGRIVAVSTTHTNIVFTTTVNTVSLHNSGTNNVFALVNSTTNALITRITEGTAVPVPAGGTYTWDAQAQASIRSLCMATTNGAAVCYLGAY
jgi:hypothetical protein